MIGNLNIANSNRKDTNIKFTKDQEIAVHELIEFLAQPWDEKKYFNALVVLEVQVRHLLLNMLLIIANGLVVL